MTKHLKLVILLFVSLTAKSQDYKGLWHGYITEFNYEITSGYLLHVKEHKDNIITGRAYIYSKKYFIFQGMLDFIGTVDKGNSKVTELVIVKSEMPTDMALLCIKFLNLSYGKKEDKDLLTGRWSGSSTQGNCRPGEVYLQRYDFSEQDQKNPIPDPILKMIATDVTPKMTFYDTELTTPIILNVNTFTVNLEIRDYLREDNDTISVHFNRKPIISNLEIKKRVFKKTVRLDKLSGLNEIIIYAENLGRIPPNTCVLTVNDGITKQKVNIMSSKQTSAVIYLNFVPSYSREPIKHDNAFEEELRKSRTPPRYPNHPGVTN